MRELVLWATLIAGELIGVALLIIGVRKRKDKQKKFRPRDLLSNKSICESSATHLALEGLFVIVAGIAFYMIWF